jgi:AraC-like DNA-binding protein
VLRKGQMEVTHRPICGAPKRLVVSEPTLLFYPRPLQHDFHNAPSEGSHLVCATLDFEGGAAHPLAQALPALVAVPLSQLPSLSGTLALLFEETEQLRCGQRLLADRLFEVLLLQLIRWLLNQPEDHGLPVGLLHGLSHPKLALALTAVHEHPGANHSLESLAQAAGMSRSAFAATFKAQLGSTPADYVLRWRVSVAQTQLRSGQAVKTVSDALGYANPASFTRAFAQVVGCSPREWLSSTHWYSSPAP